MDNVFVDLFDIDARPIDPGAALEFIGDGANGATTMFMGTVRNRNQGRDVVGITYDVFAPLAKNSFREICEEARAQWGQQVRLYVVHAKGRLPVGGISIIIAAGSPHRDEAFKACRHVIEEIKHRSAVWKQEHYSDGDSQWVQGHALCAHG